MGRQTSSVHLLAFSVLVAVANGQNDCGGYYRISSGMIAFMAICDFVLTISIALAVFYFARHSGKLFKGKALTRSSKSEKEQMESPYQELRPMEQGVYSELKPVQK
ncbi:TYRO protein tyrosine kinase-binding protein-like [Callorhinchus milii]|uniref:TYRO protein tyrosine kinase-binding protein n=1 Tax=Callorhinchus milii TaxID=7868 RepID=V9LI80_CALMI|nr:TYRO protein tyrosine kinase-binding protein-like [Callorhinchus milii]